MSLTLNASTYTEDVPRSPDWCRYTGPSNTLSLKDYVDTKRTAPKPTSSSAGKGKASFKLTRGVTDGTDYVGDVIFEITSSAPVGADAAELEAVITDVATWLATSSADDLFNDLDIKQ